MRKVVPTALAVASLPLLLVFAQNPRTPKPLPQSPVPEKNIESAKLKAEQKAELAAPPAGKPSAELNADEFQLKRYELTGRTIELTFDRILSLKEIGPNIYAALVTYHDSYAVEGVRIIVPAAGLELFKSRVAPESGGTQTVYVQVLAPDMVKVIGTHYIEENGVIKYGW